jgi:hypothetical protein
LIVSIFDLFEIWKGLLFLLLQKKETTYHSLSQFFYSQEVQECIKLLELYILACDKHAQNSSDHNAIPHVNTITPLLEMLRSIQTWMLSTSHNMPIRKFGQTGQTWTAQKLEQELLVMGEIPFHIYITFQLRTAFFCLFVCLFVCFRNWTWAIPTVKSVVVARGNENH